MRFLIFCLLLSQLSFSQLFNVPKDSAFVSYVEDLPATIAKLSPKEKNSYIYLASVNDVYNYFGYELYMKFQKFDFNRFHILGSQKCKQCLAVCHHASVNKNCHRNVCQFEWVWLKRLNEKAFTIIAEQQVIPVSDKLKKAIQFNYNDTIISNAGNSTKAIWVTHSGGDCHARFKHAIVKDNFYPIILLKEWNYYGGCRAGGQWDFAIEFSLPEGHYEYAKMEFLVD
ncbi:MAG: hypothetical protein R2796_06345 [Chitinophagaceae bacterium]